MKTLILTATAEATRRTKNRVKENGPEFSHEANSNKPGWILVRSMRTDWFGWLPTDEIKIEKSCEA
jgi:hypothetical protein